MLSCHNVVKRRMGWQLQEAVRLSGTGRQVICLARAVPIGPAQPPVCSPTDPTMITTTSSLESDLPTSFYQFSETSRSFARSLTFSRVLPGGIGSRARLGSRSCGRTKQSISLSHYKIWSIIIGAFCCSIGRHVFLLHASRSPPLCTASCMRLSNLRLSPSYLRSCLEGARNSSLRSC